ncbi:hypothetical protein LU293_04870 [Moraxella nasovis]|uniref:hypothetical protein n=1 Tax=Moraxella nasovis TaxID=2904121 RepID=UPI001F624C7B|nr:hypothetical protein [Moraxella nasovis]UNU74229.1 hypothetical protein LU293_04870 [Moraxella nasovis]
MILVQQNQPPTPIFYKQGQEKKAHDDLSMFFDGDVLDAIKQHNTPQDRNACQSDNSAVICQHLEIKAKAWAIE